MSTSTNYSDLFFRSFFGSIFYKGVATKKVHKQLSFLARKRLLVLEQRSILCSNKGFRFFVVQTGKGIVFSFIIGLFFSIFYVVADLYIYYFRQKKGKGLTHFMLYGIASIPSLCVYFFLSGFLPLILFYLVTCDTEKRKYPF